MIAKVSKFRGINQTCQQSPLTTNIFRSLCSPITIEQFVITTAHTQGTKVWSRKYPKFRGINQPDVPPAESPLEGPDICRRTRQARNILKNHIEHNFSSTCFQSLKFELHNKSRYIHIHLWWMVSPETVLSPFAFLQNDTHGRQILDKIRQNLRQKLDKT